MFGAELPRVPVIGDRSVARASTRAREKELVLAHRSAHAGPMTTPTTGSGTLSITIGPAEQTRLAGLCKRRSRADYTHDLIERLLRCPGSTRDHLSKQPAPPLPVKPSDRCKLTLRLTAQERARFESWCGRKLAVADALRAAIHADAQGLLPPAAGKGTPKPATRRASKKTAPARRKAAPRRRPSTTAKARSPRAPTPAAVPPKKAPAPNADVFAGQAQAKEYRHNRWMASIVERLALRRQEFGGLGLDPYVIVRKDRAWTSQTDELVDALDDDEAGIAIAPAWTMDVEKEVATWIADRPDGDEFRVVIGIEDREDDLYLVGLDDPGSLTDALAALPERLGRDGDYLVRTHWVSVPVPHAVVELGVRLY